MPYPANIPPTPQGYDLGESPHGVANFEYLGNQYVFLREGAELGVGDGELHVLKSTDLGLTWAETAAVAFPNSGAVVVPVAGYTVCVDGAFAYVLAIDELGTDNFTDPLCGPLTLYKYDLTLDVFTVGPVVPSGAPTVYKLCNGGAGHVPGPHVGINLVRRGTGDLLLLYSSVPETITAAKYGRVSVIPFDGTSFGAAAELPGQAANPHSFAQGGAVCDSASILHVGLGNGGGSQKFYHVAMNALGAFGTLQVVETDTFIGAHLGPPEDMSNFLGSFSNNGVDSIGFLGVHNDSADGELTLYHAVSGSLNPVWTSVPIATNPPVGIGDGANGNALATAFQYINGVLVAFWTISGTSPNWRNADGLGRIMESGALQADITTWTAPATLFNAINSTFCAVSVNAWAGPFTGVGVLGNFLNEDVPFGTEEPDFAIFGPLTVTFGNEPGTVGVPYSQPLIASGGTSPYSYSISAGSLPPGLTLDPSTGIISGTPTLAGTFPFTAEVTDELGGTATVEASITISAAAAGDPFRISLYGYKRFKNRSVCGPDLREIPDVPGPKRVL